MRYLRDIETKNRPREKALRDGIESLSNEELLAIVIGNGGKNNSVLDISRTIMDKYKTFSNFLNSNLYDLMKIKGIKIAKALNVLAIIEIAKRANQETVSYSKSYNCPQDIYDIVKYELENEKQECFIVIYFNVKLKVIKKEILFKGGVSTTFVDINLMFKNAIMYGAKCIVCIHNHPSGDPTPSKEDFNITERIRKYSKIVNIELLDHIIIGKNDYFSFTKMKL